MNNRLHLRWVVFLTLAMSFAQISLTNAAELINGGVISDAISLPGEQDVHTFTANAGESVQLRVAHTGNTVALTPRLDGLISMIPMESSLSLLPALATLPPFFVIATPGFVKSPKRAPIRSSCPMAHRDAHRPVLINGTSGRAQTGPYNLYLLPALATLPPFFVIATPGFVKSPKRAPIRSSCPMAHRDAHRPVLIICILRGCLEPMKAVPCPVVESSATRLT